MKAMYLLYENAQGYALLEAAGLDEIGATLDGVQKSVTDLARFSKVRFLNVLKRSTYQFREKKVYVDVTSRTHSCTQQVAHSPLRLAKLVVLKADFNMLSTATLVIYALLGPFSPTRMQELEVDTTIS
jgi:hypothetical protein